MSLWASHCVFLLALFWNLWIATGHKSMWIRRLAYFKTLRTHSALTEWSVYKLFKWLDSRLLLLKCTFVTISSSADLIRFRSQSQSPIVYNWGWIEYERWIQTAWVLMPLFTFNLFGLMRLSPGQYLAPNMGINLLNQTSVYPIISPTLVKLRGAGQCKPAN